MWIIIFGFWNVIWGGQLVDGLKDVDQVSLKVPWAIESDVEAGGLRERSGYVTVLRLNKIL